VLALDPEFEKTTPQGKLVAGREAGAAKSRELSDMILTSSRIKAVSELLIEAGILGHNYDVILRELNKRRWTPPEVHAAWKAIKNNPDIENKQGYRVASIKKGRLSVVRNKFIKRRYAEVFDELPPLRLISRKSGLETRTNLNPEALPPASC